MVEELLVAGCEKLWSWCADDDDGVVGVVVAAASPSLAVSGIV